MPPKRMPSYSSLTPLCFCLSTGFVVLPKQGCEPLLALVVFRLNFSFDFSQFLFDLFYTLGDCFNISPFACTCELVEHAIALIVLYANVAHKEIILANFWLPYIAFSLIPVQLRVRCIKSTQETQWKTTSWLLMGLLQVLRLLSLQTRDILTIYYNSDTPRRLRIHETKKIEVERGGS